MTYNWSFGDGVGSNDTDPSYTYQFAGTYNVCLEIESAEPCIDTYCMDVTVASVETCNANFNILSQNGLTVQFNNESTTDDGGVLTYNWSFGDGVGSTAIDPLHTYVFAGTYNVCLEIESAEPCMDTYCLDVTVAPLPTCNADFNILSQNGLTVQFNNESTSGDGGVLTYNWSFGDGVGATDADPSYTYEFAGTYNVCLEVESAEPCTDTYCTDVTVTDPCIALLASFSYIIDPDNPLLVHFTDNSNGLTAWEWYWDDGTVSDGVSTDASTSYTFPGFFNYNVCLVAINGSCTDEYCLEVPVVNPVDPCANFFADFSYSIASDGLTVQFEADYDPIADYWTWDFDDGTNHTDNITPNPEHLYFGPFVHNVCLVIESDEGCREEICKLVDLIDPLCHSADLDLAADSLLTCSTDPLTLTANFNDFILYEWYLNGTLVDDEPTVVADQTGWYRLRVEDECYHDAWDSTYVYFDDDCVWPGDVNRDAWVDFDDLLDWGLDPLGISGNVRDTSNFTAAYEWVEQPCIDWNMPMLIGVDSKHADCNGDGQKTLADPLAILQNFHNSPPPNILPKQVASNSAIRLTAIPVDINDFTADGINDTIFFDIHLEDTLGNLVNAYGLRFRVDYNQFATGNGVINAESWFNQSWMGTDSSDFLGAYKNFQTDSTMYVGMTRVDQQNALGTGKVCKVGCLVDIEVLGIHGIDYIFTANRQNEIQSDTLFDYHPLEITLKDIRLVDANNSISEVDPVQTRVWLKSWNPPVIGNLRIQLQGTYDATIGNMRPRLAEEGLLPFSQPFIHHPWYITDTVEIVDDALYQSGIVDWAIVELRAVHDPHIVVERQLALINTYGDLIDPSGRHNGLVFYKMEEEAYYYVVVKARNHLAVISNYTIQATNQSFSYDFSTALDQVQGDHQMIEVATGVFALAAGDIDSDGIITLPDFNIFRQESAKINQYVDSDLNMDSNVTIKDFNLYFANSSLIGSPYVR